MKRSIVVTALALATVALAPVVSAQSSASHDVTIAVSAIDEISVSGNVTLTINDITLSQSAAASYSVTTNGVNRESMNAWASRPAIPRCALGWSIVVVVFSSFTGAAPADLSTDSRSLRPSDS